MSSSRHSRRRLCSCCHPLSRRPGQACSVPLAWGAAKAAARPQRYPWPTALGGGGSQSSPAWPWRLWLSALLKPAFPNTSSLFQRYVRFVFVYSMIHIIPVVLKFSCSTRARCTSRWHPSAAVQENKHTTTHHRTNISHKSACLYNAVHQHTSTEFKTEAVLRVRTAVAG